MKKNAEIAIKTISAVIVFLFFVTCCFYSYRFLRCFADSRNIRKINPYDMVHFTLFGSSEDTVSGKFTLYNTAGREVAEIERSWNAEDLSLEFTAACFNDRQFIFPYEIYGNSNERKTSGTLLGSYFMEHGECLLLSPAYSAKERRALYHLAVFAFARSKSYLNRFSRQYTVDLYSCVAGKEYMVIVSQTGMLQLTPVDD